MRYELIHAWLNLRDKHMTTGRINQITHNNHTQTNNIYQTKLPSQPPFHIQPNKNIKKITCLWVNESDSDCV